MNITGTAEKMTAAESDQYWQTRSRGSQLGAWASNQSSELATRSTLETQYNKFASKYPETIPRPPHWGGWRIVPAAIEFWQGRTNRLHDRILYTTTDRTIRTNTLWSVKRLAP